MTGPAQTRLTAVGYLWKSGAIALAYLAATVVWGGVVTALKLDMPRTPAAEAQHQLLLLIAGSLLVGGCLAPLARGIGGATTGRWLVLAAFAYVCNGFNNAIEAAVFTTLGGTPAMMLLFVAPCALAAWVAVRLIPAAPAPRAGVRSRWWRLVLAWLAFPVIYYSFGMLAYPWVREVYEQPEMSLRVPAQAVVVSVALLRSLLFLAVTVPVVARWTGSRRALTLSLAAGYFVLIGLYGLLQTTWWPAGMRVVHGLEILADSVVCAWVMVRLLAPAPRATAAAAGLVEVSQ